jgi:hypothetical protein
MPIRYIFTLKMATTVFPKMLVNSQHLTRLIPKSQSCTLNSSRENLWTRQLKRCTLLEYIKIPEVFVTPHMEVCSHLF